MKSGKKQNVEISIRQKEIVPMVEMGMNNNEIADRLFISIKAVEYHRSKFINDLCAKNMIDAIRIAKEKKII